MPSPSPCSSAETLGPAIAMSSTPSPSKSAVWQPTSVDGPSGRNQVSMISHCLSPRSTSVQTRRESTSRTSSSGPPMRSAKPAQPLGLSLRVSATNLGRSGSVMSRNSTSSGGPLGSETPALGASASFSSLVSRPERPSGKSTLASTDTSSPRLAEASCRIKARAGV